jgi:acyl-CoA hydrolase
MEWIDKAGYACAVGWSGSYCVTANVGNVRHRRPIPPGSLIEVQARLVHTGRTSMHIIVTVCAAAVSDPRYAPATTCVLIFVAKGADGRPTPVPKWKPTSVADQLLAAFAADRVESRARIKRLMVGESYDEETAAPRVGLRFLAPPGSVNWGGHVHGGTVMRWIDEAAYACAAGWAKDGRVSSEAIAVYSGGIHFFSPVRIGDLVTVDARIVLTSRRSMHLVIRVTTADPRTPASTTLTTQCMSVFVVPAADGTAARVPQWRPTTEGERRLWEHAERVIAIRGSITPLPASLTLEP